MNVFIAYSISTLTSDLILPASLFSSPFSHPLSLLPLPPPPLFPTFFSHTEASKLVMQYVAAVSGKGEEVDRVKEQLLQSNPVLEGSYIEAVNVPL